jgi:hypothetical protein
MARSAHNRKEPRLVAEAQTSTLEAPEAQETTMDTNTSFETDADIQTDAADYGSVEVEISGIKVNLPVRFMAGHVLTDAQAKVLDAAFQRQFRNNQESNAKALLKAGKPLMSAAELLEKYATYEPNVGASGRLPAMEKVRQDAAWNAWRNMVNRHNDSIANGGEPVIVKAGSKPVSLPSGKGAADQRTALVEALLARPEYSDMIQAEVDAIMAERGKTEAKPDSVKVSVDLL